MIKKMQYKFVLITMALMLFVFSILFGVNHFYQMYLLKLDSVTMLGSFMDNQTFIDELLSQEGMDGERSKFIFAIFDQEGNLIKEKSSKAIGKQEKLNQIVHRIYRKGPDTWKWRNYIYTFRPLKDNKSLLLVTDISDHSFTLKKGIGIGVIVVLSVLLLFGVSYYLSRFVTKPAKEAFEREKQFISDVSHELKTPITAISINAQALQGQIDENKYLRNIMSESKRMDALIHRLLTLSFYEESTDNVKKEHFSLTDSCEEIALTMESVSYEKNLQFVYSIEKDIFYYGNCEEIKQVIIILIDNAIKHTPINGQIEFFLSEKENRPEIHVINTGAGILPEDIPHIFERFYCGEKSRNTKKDSFGLGLAIAKAILDRNGGSITVKSEFGKYAKFTILL